MGILTGLLIVAACVFAIWLLFKLLKWPLKILWKLVINIVVGFVILMIFNLIGGNLFGFTLTIDWLTSLITGIFGIPGVIVLVILELI